MKRQPNGGGSNRIDADLAVWDKRQQQYAGTFGPDVMRDRDFLKAKYQVLQQINNKHAKTNLSFDEQISRRILRGQLRQLNRRIYPNPVIRLLRNTVVLIGKVMTFPVNVGKNLANVIPSRPARPEPVNSLTGNHQTLADEVVGPTKVISAPEPSQYNAWKKQQQGKNVGFASHLQTQQELARKTLSQNRELLPETLAKGRKM
jgi:hypothetical protein